MRCLAEFEVLSDLCLSENEPDLKLDHPSGIFELKIRNGSSQQAGPAPLIFQLIFEATDLTLAEDEAAEHLIGTLDLLTYATSSKFKYHRAIKIIDWTPDLVDRECLYFSEFDPGAIPEPELNKLFLTSVESLLRIDTDASIKRAFRWYRLGVGEEVTEDQFQYFWFALEIIAEIRKEKTKVYDQCPVCRGKLFCEACKTFPTHRPYPKQAIRQLFQTLIQNNGDDLFLRFDKARNTIMHGALLKDIESQILISSDHLINLLGQITRDALLWAVRPELLTQKLHIGVRPEYVRRKLVGKAGLTVQLPKGPDGEPDLTRFPKLQITFETVRKFTLSDPKLGPSSKSNQTT